VETLKLLRIEEVSLQTGLCSATVRRLIKRGELPAMKLSRNAIRVRESDLAAFLASKKAA